MSLPPSRPALSIGLVLAPHFTLLALSAFVDTLRLAADESDRSRPIHCSWTVMSENSRPVVSSSGLTISPAGGFASPEHFDYVVVVGGTLHHGASVSDALLSYLQLAAERNVPLIGVCTGGFILARAGLMKGRQCCVSWLHRDELAAEFPDLKVVADRLYVVDGDRITCAGGTSVVHLASWLVEQHLGPGRSDKGLRVMLEERPRGARSPQPPPAIPGLQQVRDSRVRRAMLMIERQLLQPLAVVAIAQEIGTTSRQLSRLFDRELGLSPTAFRDQLRLYRARALVRETRQPMTQIAGECGFADAAHFSRRYRRLFDTTPSADRRSMTLAG